MWIAKKTLSEEDKKKAIPKHEPSFDAARNAKWQSRKDLYHLYLKSPEWQKKRLLVLERDSHLCQGEGCRQTATQAHHLTYDHIGDELLEELVSLCSYCHHKIHVQDPAWAYR